MEQPGPLARPVVFVSSTILDFVDLRDALKFWLEEMGFDVRLSEHTDFERRPEAGTFDACFDSIRDSDYYVLLIGLNRGSWFDEPKGVSVTRQEYRTALEAFHTTGRPKIVSLVRSDVLTILRERRHVGESTGPSQLQDPEFTASFISEVRREEKVATAAQQSEEHPASNWLAPFRTFRELVDILRSTLGIRGPLPRVALAEALRRECEHNLRLAMSNSEGKPFYSHVWLDRVRCEVNLTPDDLKGLNTPIALTFKQMQDVLVYSAMGGLSHEQFVTIILDEAITSSALLDYDRQTNQFVPSPLLEALYRLRGEIESYRRRYQFTDDARRAVSVEWFRVRPTKSDASLPSMTLFALYSLHDTHQNVVRLLLGILRHLYGHSAGIEVQLRPGSPIEEFEDAIRRDTVTEEQLSAWLSEDNLFLRLGTHDPTEEETREQERIEAKLRERLGNEKYEARLAEIRNRLAKEAGLGDGAEDHG